MFSETTISYVKIGNHPIETTIYKWLALGFQAVHPPQKKIAQVNGKAEILNLMFHYRHHCKMSHHRKFWDNSNF